MKLFIVLLIAIAAVHTQAPANNMTPCVQELISNVDEIMSSGTEYLNGNTLGGIAKMVEAFGDLNKSFTDCKKVTLTDGMMWLDAHTNQTQKDCLSKVIAGLMSIKGAQDTWNDKTKSTADKMKAWGVVVSNFDVSWNQCMAPFQK